MLKKFILVLNCGSSSLKFSVINPKNEKVYLSGIAEKFFLNKPVISWKVHGITKKIHLENNSSHKTAIHYIVKNILNKYPKILSDIFGIGHRIVHGGIKLKKSSIINSKIIQEIKKAVIFAPLHNPANLIGIKEFQKYFPYLKNKNVAVFDTTFHTTIPEKAYLYALPFKLYKKYGIRKYGAHGISYNYITYKTAKILNKSIKNLNIIICHLGNGASVAAIRNGKCVDTSMGVTPLEGLVMGTRSGDIDPAIIFFLYENLNMKIQEIKNLLMHQSGLLGLSEISNDYRYIEKHYIKNVISAKRAINIFCYRLAKYIASYSILMKNGNLDALIFTGGIGENATIIRSLTISQLSSLKLKIDENKNFSIKSKKLGFINKDNTIPIIVITSNEELVIAKETNQLIK